MFFCSFQISTVSMWTILRNPKDKMNSWEVSTPGSTVSVYSDTLNPHISALFKAQLVIHWSATHISQLISLSSSVALLISCEVNIFTLHPCFMAWIKSVLSISTFTHQGAEQSGGCHGSLLSSALLSSAWTPSLFHFKPSLSPCLSSTHTHWVMSTVRCRVKL